jgi:DNA replication protein DnaC
MTPTHPLDIDSLEARLASLTPATDAELAELAEEEREARVRELRSFINAPPRIAHFVRVFHGLESDHPWQAKYRSLLKILEEDNGATIGICGGSGRGKTTLAVMILWEAAARLLTGRYTSLFSMLGEFADSRREGRLLRAVHSFSRVDVLVIDQCDKASTSLQDAAAFLEIVDRRHNSRLMTILIGNGSSQEFASVLGESIHSRINATGGMVVCDWPRF